MQEPVHERLQISPFMAAFIVMAMQFGIGVLGFQRIVAKEAGYDAWISIIGIGLLVHFIVWIMYRICEAVDGDILTANVYVFGKAIGNTINSFFIIYFISACVAVLGGLVEVIRTWMFPNLSPLLFGSMYLILGIYIVYGGFRTVTGISFFGLVIPSYLLFSFAYAIRYGDFTNLLPILDHSPLELLKSAYSMSFTVLGFGVLLFFHPFIKNPEKSKKWVHGGIFLITLIYAILAIISFAYFPPALLNKSIWATLEMWKIVRLPIIERFEYLGIANWSLIILPNVAICLWTASRVIKHVFHLRQRKGVWFVAAICLLLILIVDSRERMDMFTSFHGIIGFGLAFVYTPLLYLAILVAKKVKKK
ncbi:spore germination protein [Mesobacillus maritimus]|uniref:GerAB/ArcD/ProY family transporter n=1 Tax=Mesobacillus maritimus TaxID=1643336 RepID=UPI00203F7A5F|nr:GerAB/ArcD/ProY family transporter [Mesobacillus maritimus]MCM3670313.1 spore germination protein [Mesobacillus maritimus]